MTDDQTTIESIRRQIAETDEMLAKQQMENAKIKERIQYLKGFVDGRKIELATL